MAKTSSVAAAKKALLMAGKPPTIVEASKTDIERAGRMFPGQKIRITQ